MRHLSRPRRSHCAPVRLWWGRRYGFAQGRVEPDGPFGSCLGDAIIDSRVVLVDEIHEGLKVRCGPPPVEIGIAETQIPLPDQAREDIIVMDLDMGYRARFMPLDAEHPAIGQFKIQAPVINLLRLLKDCRKIPRQIALPLYICHDTHQVPPKSTFCEHTAFPTKTVSLLLQPPAVTMSGKYRESPEQATPIFVCDANTIFMFGQLSR